MINTEEQYVKAIIEQADNTKAIYDLTCFYDQQGNRNGARYLAMQLQKRLLEPSMEPLVEQYCEFLIEKKEMIKNFLNRLEEALKPYVNEDVWHHLN